MIELNNKYQFEQSLALKGALEECALSVPHCAVITGVLHIQCSVDQPLKRLGRTGKMTQWL